MIKLNTITPSDVAQQLRTMSESPDKADEVLQLLQLA